MIYRGLLPLIRCPWCVGWSRNWWLASTNPWNGNNERNVNPSGALNNNNANNTNGACPRL